MVSLGNWSANGRCSASNCYFTLGYTSESVGIIDSLIRGHLPWIGSWDILQKPWVFALVIARIYGTWPVDRGRWWFTRVWWWFIDDLWMIYLLYMMICQGLPTKNSDIPLSPGLGRGFCLVAGGLGERLGYPGCSAVIIAFQRPWAFGSPGKKMMHF